MWIEHRNGRIIAREQYTDRTGHSKKVSVDIPKETPRELKKAAQALQRIIEHELRPISDMMLSEVIEAYYSEQVLTLKFSTAETNHGYLRRFQSFAGDIQISKVTAGFIRSALIQHSSDPATVNNYTKKIKAFMRWAYQNDYTDDPASYEKLQYLKDAPKRVKIQNKYLEPDQLPAFFEAFNLNYNKLVAQFLVLTGVRVGELFALENSDIGDKVIRISKNYDYEHKITAAPKTAESNREISIQSELIPVIHEIKKATQLRKLASGDRSDLFVISMHGGHMHLNSFAEAVRKASAAAGNQISPHALRHTHASLLAAQGVPLETISRRLGHNGSKITKEIYLHVTKDMKEKDAEIVRGVRLLSK